MAEKDRTESLLVGANFRPRAAQVAYVQLTEGQPLVLSREKNNPHDSNAIRVLDLYGKHIAYIERDVAALVSPRIDGGEVWLARVKKRPRKTRRAHWSMAVAILWTSGEEVQSVRRCETVLV